LKIWLLTFESKDTVKIGGLAEVPPRLGEALASRGHNVSIITPDHGFSRKDAGSMKIVVEYSYMGVSYRILLYDKPVVKHYLVSGGALDEPEVYSPKYLSEKARLFAIGVNHLLLKSIEDGETPDIIHCNDWHSVQSLLLARKTAYDHGLGTRFFYQIHLLSRKKFELNELTKDLGLEPDDLVQGFYGVKTIREYYEYSMGYADRLGGLLSNKLLTVSKEYVKEVVKRIGFDLENHVSYIPNATTWSLDGVINETRKYHPSLSSELGVDNVIDKPRADLRKYLLTQAISMLRENEPLIDDPYLKNIIYKVDTPPFKGGGRVEAFKEDGPLALMTGRLSRQKGFHVLLKAIDQIVYQVPEIKILIHPLPLWSEEELVKKLIEYSILYRENIRVVFGKAPSIFSLAHLSSDLMIAPSIYEPFGLMVLESFASGTPVVGSYTGGIAETILDISRYGVLGTGLHVKPGDPNDLASKLVDLALFMDSYYHEPWSRGWLRNVERISSDVLKEILLSNPHAPLLVRRSCVARANEYGWAKSAEKALEIYGAS